MMTAREDITRGYATLGIEFGSTNIKAVLLGKQNEILATGNHAWQNKIVDGFWSYSTEEIISGMQACYSDLADNVAKQYHTEINSLASIGISAMMHGYLAFDSDNRLLTPFRTWRNTNTGEAANRLSSLFDFNVPMRWSIAHLYQAILDDEDHVQRIHHLNTLAGYVHWLLTDQLVLGVGDASGMFPIDPETKDYNAAMIDKFQTLVGDAYQWKLSDILPRVLTAGMVAGTLSAKGACLLDSSGSLKPGAVFCPPEGDAGTGMVATNAVGVRTGNVSIGTSIFEMVVLEESLAKHHPEIDIVATPTGKTVAMVHCNNGASELDEWAKLFGDFAERIGAKPTTGEIFDALIRASAQADPDGNGLMFFNYLSGEPITGLSAGRPLFFRTPNSSLTLANFILVQLYSILATLKIGMNILSDEGVNIDVVVAHGGLLKTKNVAQQIVANTLNTPVAVARTASNGGAWGIAVLARFTSLETNISLEEYLSEKVFSADDFSVLYPDSVYAEGFNSFLTRYRQSLEVQKAAVANS